MGHAHHFLSRLDRLSGAHVELALTLYREDARLRYVLQEARVPEGAERVAVSLDDPHEGPFVLVTRAGRFVTCLGRGMRADNLPIITRAELDAITEKRSLWLGRDAAMKQLTEPGGGAAWLLGRILDAGPYLAREEFQALAALQPLIGDEYLSTAFEWAQANRLIQTKLTGVLKKRGARLRADQLEQLHVYWKTFFAAGHLANLALVDGGELVHARAEGDDKTFAVLLDGLTAVILDGGILAKTIRGAWALGQLGERGIPHLRGVLARASSAVGVLNATLPLLAIGARRADLRAEVVDILAHCPELTTEEARIWARYVCEGGVNLMANVESVSADHPRLGAALAVALADAFPTTSPYHYTREEDVPADIAFGGPFQLVSNFTREQGMLPKALSMIVPAARATPEQLYLPRRYTEFLDLKWQPEQALQLMEGWLEEARKPAPRPAGPARKGPCPCGSGKKYKRCCGEEERA